MSKETSYECIYGNGKLDRRNVIQVKTNLNYEPNNPPEHMIDGKDDTYFRLSGKWQSGGYIEFIFKEPLWIDEIYFDKRQWLPTPEIDFYNDNNQLVGSTNGRGLVSKNSLTLTKTKSLKLFAPVGENEKQLIYNLFLKCRTENNKILIKKDNQYGYYTESFHSLGTSYPTKEQFEQYGMNDLSILEPCDVSVEYEMELISETDEEKCFSYTFDLNGQHENMKSIDGITIK